MTLPECAHHCLPGCCDIRGCEHAPRAEHVVASEFVLRQTTLAEARFALGVIAVASEIYDWKEEALALEYEGVNEIELRSQVAVGGCRIDFVFYREQVPPLPVLVVEIDDPSHWRDAQKAAADRARDRRHLATGVPTMRFSNDEICDDPIAAAKQALQYVLRVCAQFEAQREREHEACLAGAAGERPAPALVVGSTNADQSEAAE